MIEVGPELRLGVYEYLALKDYMAGLFEGPVDVVRRKGLRSYVGPSVIAEAIYAF